jgi:hypothetical protein
MNENRRLASESQKKANDALFKGLDSTTGSLKADARTLERLQSAAQGASGQMQAIGYANQLASQQANQLLQIRGLLIAQQNAVATKHAGRSRPRSAAASRLRTTAPGSTRASPARLVRGIHAKQSKALILAAAALVAALLAGCDNKPAVHPAGSERRELQAREHRQAR